jgi:hypothetical protein
MDDIIVGERLTTFDISPDGDRFCLNFTDQSGSSAGLSLPSECLIQLIMTLPEMASKALKVRYRDDTLRIVYPLGTFRMEASNMREIAILTLATQDGFKVSFGLTDENLKGLSETIHDARSSERPIFIKN